MTRKMTRRGVLAASGVLLGGCLGDGTETTADPPDGAVANAPIPDDPGAYDYETMGKGDAPVTARYFTNWKCPHCADFSTGFLSTVVSDYVEPGDLVLEHRALAYTSRGPWMGEDAPRAAEAGLAVWNTDPDSYWGYHEHVMANQRSPNETWATTDRLVQFARDSDVSDIDSVRSAIENGTYNQAVRQTAAIAEQVGISSTPTLVIGNTAVSALDESAVRETIESALESA